MKHVGQFQRLEEELLNGNRTFFCNKDENKMEVDRKSAYVLGYVFVH